MGAFLTHCCLGCSLLKTIDSEENTFRENTGGHMGQVLLVRIQLRIQAVTLYEQRNNNNNNKIVGFWELQLSTTWND